MYAKLVCMVHTQDMNFVYVSPPARYYRPRYYRPRYYRPRYLRNQDNDDRWYGAITPSSYNLSANYARDSLSARTPRIPALGSERLYFAPSWDMAHGFKYN